MLCRALSLCVQERREEDLEKRQEAPAQLPGGHAERAGSPKTEDDPEHQRYAAHHEERPRGLGRNANRPNVAGLRHAAQHDAYAGGQRERRDRRRSRVPGELPDLTSD